MNNWQNVGICQGITYFGFLCATSVVLCGSVVKGMHDTTTTESQRTQRLHREEFNLGHYHVRDSTFGPRPNTE
jgi:hypothetical protein